MNLFDYICIIDGDAYVTNSHTTIVFYGLQQATPRG